MNAGFQVNMMTLAEHIIEATPDRIKQENFVPMESSALEKTDTATISGTMSWLASYLADVDHLPSAIQIRSVYAGFQWQRGRPVGLVGGGGCGVGRTFLASGEALGRAPASLARPSGSPPLPWLFSPNRST